MKSEFTSCSRTRQIKFDIGSIKFLVSMSHSRLGEAKFDTELSGEVFFPRIPFPDGERVAPEFEASIRDEKQQEMINEKRQLKQLRSSKKR